MSGCKIDFFSYVHDYCFFFRKMVKKQLTQDFSSMHDCFAIVARAFVLVRAKQKVLYIYKQPKYKIWENCK